ncbi:MAG: hypothetical protein H6Q14_695 [Bacteroidetes bacterium]|jgi:hypothetical protein|nr:hypothetical protein [Bacteroidota bacterium]
MKNIGLLPLIIGLIFLGCTQKNDVNNRTVSRTDSINVPVTPNDKEEIQNLIRQTLNWADSKSSIDLLPVLADPKDSAYIGFDLKKHRENLKKLKATNFFTTKFIENYNQIILTLDKKLRNKELDEWLVGELQPFSFANDIDPWSLNQDVPYDKPNPWNLVEVEIINLNNNKGKLVWRWGRLEQNTDSEWKAFRYKFEVAKEDEKWKIDYLQGFDFDESIR